jgi:hypothetical protein
VLRGLTLDVTTQKPRADDSHTTTKTTTGADNFRIHFEGRTGIQLPTGQGEPTNASRDSPERGTAAFQFGLDSHRLPDGLAATGEGVFILSWSPMKESVRSTGYISDYKMSFYMDVHINMKFKRPARINLEEDGGDTPPPAT